MNSSDRIIIHLDMNAFFASVEQADNPSLRGKAIAVTGSGNRTVITTASYEARAFGVKTGMNSFEAKRVCPHLIFVVGNNRRYAETSTGIVNLMREYTPQVEVFSIDEAFMDVTGCMKMFGSAERIAELLKARIREQFNLTCSVGIAPNKLLAKLASDMMKPDGLTIITSENVHQILVRVPVKDLCGIGPKTQKALNLLGIRTCGDLGRYPVEVLRKKFGVFGDRLHNMGLGIDDSPVIVDEDSEETKTIGHSMTFDRDVSSPNDLARHLLELSEMVGRRARKYGLSGKTVTVTIRYSDFTTFSKQASLSEHVNLTQEIYAAAKTILSGINLTQPVRLLGVRLSGLCEHVNQLSLFKNDDRKTRATEAMDILNGKFGPWTVKQGTLVEGEERGVKVISPAWRPTGIRKVDVE